MHIVINHFCNYRYRSRLKANNLMYIKQIMFVLTCLMKVLSFHGDDKQLSSHESDNTRLKTDATLNKVSNTKLLTVNNFLFEAQLDNINLFKIQQFCKKSLIARKLNGFVEKYRGVEVPIQQEEKPKHGLSSFLTELSTLKVQKQEEIQNVDKCDANSCNTQVNSHYLNIDILHILVLCIFQIFIYQSGYCSYQYVQYSCLFVNYYCIMPEMAHDWFK